MCDKDKKLLENWSSRLDAKDGDLLTEKGSREQKALGKRIQQRLPELMKKIQHHIQVMVRATNKERTQQSAASYLSGFLDYMAQQPNLTIISGEDYLLKFSDFCTRYIAEVDDPVNVACPEIEQFDKKSISYMNDLRTFKNRINVSDEFNNGKKSLYLNVHS